MTDDATTWCTTCGERFTDAQVEGATACPGCGARGTPCAAAEDFLIEINWHELRLLGIWATNWGESIKDDSDGSDPEGSRQALRGILSRLERQHPEGTPLTLGGEIRQMRQSIAAGELKGVTGLQTNVKPEGVVPVRGPGAVGFGKRPGD